jgi:hypothetical protein
MRPVSNWSKPPVNVNRRTWKNVAPANRFSLRRKVPTPCLSVVNVPSWVWQSGAVPISPGGACDDLDEKDVVDRVELRIAKYSIKRERYRRRRARPLRSWRWGFRCPVERRHLAGSYCLDYGLTGPSRQPARPQPTLRPGPEHDKCQQRDSRSLEHHYPRFCVGPQLGHRTGPDTQRQKLRRSADRTPHRAQHTPALPQCATSGTRHTPVDQPARQPGAGRL